MNKKGMSLIEIVVTLLILSIAGVMIASGFMSVFRFIANANEMQQQSDVLASYAEKSNDLTIRDQVQLKRTVSTYTISNEDGKKVEVYAQIHALTSIKKDALSLYTFENEDKDFIKESPSYYQMKEKVELFYNRINEATAKLIFDPYASVFRSLYIDEHMYNGTWEVFPSELLPSVLASSASAIMPYNLVGTFPWEYLRGREVVHGSVLLYLSQSYYEGLPAPEKETIHMIYDYIGQRWYYYPGNDYVIDYASKTDDQPIFLYEGSNQVITSYEDLLRYIKASDSGWFILDENLAFDEEDPDSFYSQMK